MSVEHWERYYRGGGFATCPTHPDGTYDAEVLAAWQAFFNSLAPAARIVDLGTGNGAIPVIARQQARRQGSRWEIHGVDLAQIDPVRDLPAASPLLEGIHFHAGVSGDALPFEAHSIDAITGQYALEYMPLRGTLGEVARVLRPAGRAQFILHHDRSELVVNAKESLGQIELICSTPSLYAALRTLLEAERVSQQATAQASSDMQRVVQRLLDAKREARSSLILDVTLDALQKLWAARLALSPAAMEAEVTKVEDDLLAARFRLQDLQQHAQSAEDMNKLVELAATLGLDTRELDPQLHGGDHLVGWRLLLEAR